MRVNPDNAPEKQEEYKIKLSTMTDDELFNEANNKIWLSAYANNNPISCFHWQADATYNESKNRQKPEIYTRAYNKAVDSCR